jgi:hypothetical protein
MWSRFCGQVSGRLFVPKGPSDRSLAVLLPEILLPGYYHSVPLGQNPSTCPHFRLHIKIVVEDENDDEYDCYCAAAPSSPSLV